MDIVYLVKNDDENDSEELRYSLRSLKNIPHNKVFIVGEKPNWATNVTYLPVLQNETKNVNVSKNLHTAAQSELISDNFILMNDDFFFMKQIDSMPNVNFGPAVEVIEQYRKRYPKGSGYIDSMIAQHNQLNELGIHNSKSYELHVPMVIDRNNLKELFSENNRTPRYQFRTFYGNYYNVGGETIPDVKVFLNQEQNSPEYIKNPLAYLENQTFLSATGGSFKRGLVGEFVRKKFQEKSDYEF